MRKIILYTNGCPKCKILKSKLEEKKIDFEENNNVEELIPMGIQSLPVLVEENYLTFVEANAWVNNQPLPETTEIQEEK